MLTSHLAGELIACLLKRGVPATYDSDEQLVVATPPGAPATRTAGREHIVFVHIGTHLKGEAPEFVQGLVATAWGSDGPPDFAEITTVYRGTSHAYFSADAERCAQAVAEWFTVPRQTNGDVLITALNAYGITGEPCYDTYAIPLDPNARPGTAGEGPHLWVCGPEGFLDRVPTAHDGWVVGVSDHAGTPDGGYLYRSDGSAGCTAESDAAAAVIASYLNTPGLRLTAT